MSRHARRGGRVPRVGGRASEHRLVLGVFNHEPAVAIPLQALVMKEIKPKEGQKPAPGAAKEEEGVYLLEGGKARFQPVKTGLLGELNGESALVFCNLREAVERVKDYLGSQGVEAGMFHGGMEQLDRERELSFFRNGSTTVFVSTDLAARGLDIQHQATQFFGKDCAPRLAGKHHIVNTRRLQRLHHQLTCGGLPGALQPLDDDIVTAHFFP